LKRLESFRRPDQLAASILKKEQHLAEIMGKIRKLLAGKP